MRIDISRLIQKIPYNGANREVYEDICLCFTYHLYYGATREINPEDNIYICKRVLMEKYSQVEHIEDLIDSAFKETANKFETILTHNKSQMVYFKFADVFIPKHVKLSTTDI